MSASCLRLEEVYKCRGSCAWGRQGPYTLGTARVPAIQAAAPAPFLILSETKVPGARKYPSSPTSPVPVAPGSPGELALCSQLPHGRHSRSPLQQAARGCRKPWENHVSYSPELLLPCIPGAARGPETQAAAALPHLVLTGAEPSPPGQLREHTAMDNPHAEMEIKPRLNPRGSVAWEEDWTPSYEWYKLQVKSKQSTRQTLCLWNAWRDNENSHRTEDTDSGGCGHWRQEYTGVAPEFELSQEQIQRPAQSWRAS